MWNSRTRGVWQASVRRAARVHRCHAPPMSSACCLGRLRRFGVRRWDSASTPSVRFLARVFQHGLNVVTDSHDRATMPRPDKLAGYRVFMFRWKFAFVTYTLCVLTLATGRIVLLDNCLVLYLQWNGTRWHDIDQTNYQVVLYHVFLLECSDSHQSDRASDKHADI